MSTPKDWRVTGNFDDWLRHAEKRIAHLERRPQVTRASDLMGPGLAPQAVETLDWSGPETEFNGFFVSGPGAMHAPDQNKWWIGFTMAQPEGFGIQVVWDFRSTTSPTPKYSRRFSMVGGTRLFSSWTVDSGTGGGGGATNLDSLTDVVITSPATGHLLRYNGTNWVNANLAATDLPSHTHTKSQITDLGTIGTAAAKNAPATGNAASAEVVLGSDTRLTDARTPTTHTHTKSQITDLGTIGTAAAKDVPSSGNASAAQVVLGNDTRLADARTPLAHTHAIADLPVAASGTSNATQLVRADDSRLGNARTPTAHAATHAVAGSDPITPSSIGAAFTSHSHTKSQITDFAHTHPVTDLTATGTRDSTTFLRGDGGWAVPPNGVAGGGTIMAKISSTIPQNIATSVWSTITFENKEWDTAAMVPATNNKIVIPNDGKYACAGMWTWQANTAGRRVLEFWINGAEGPRVEASPANTGNMSQSIYQEFSLKAGDVLELKAWQNSGATLTAANAYPCVLSVRCLSFTGTPPTIPAPSTYDTGWITVGTPNGVAFQNGWTHYNAGGYALAGYRRIGNVVTLRGLVKAGSNVATMFTLPADFRPPFTAIRDTFVNQVNEVSSAASAGTAHTHPVSINNVTARLDIQADGAVLPNSSTAAVSYWSLEGISFYTD